MYLSDKQLAERFGVSRVTIWRWAKNDATFPRPVVLTPGTSRWKLADIEAWEAKREEAA